MIMSCTFILTIPVLEIWLALVGLYLAISVSLPQSSLLRVVEPLDPDHHAGAPRLPEALHSAHVGQLGPTRWQEDSAIPNTYCLLAPHNGLIEKLAGFTLQTSPLSGYENKNSTLSQFIQWRRVSSAQASDIESLFFPSSFVLLQWINLTVNLTFRAETWLWNRSKLDWVGGWGESWHTDNSLLILLEPMITWQHLLYCLIVWLALAGIHQRIRDAVVLTIHTTWLN